jgi:hypothetical protein
LKVIVAGEDAGVFHSKSILLLEGADWMVGFPSPLVPVIEEID